MSPEGKILVKNKFAWRTFYYYGCEVPSMLILFILDFPSYGPLKCLRELKFRLFKKINRRKKKAFKRIANIGLDPLFMFQPHFIWALKTYEHYEICPLLGHNEQFFD